MEAYQSLGTFYGSIAGATGINIYIYIGMISCWSIRTPVLRIGHVNLVSEDLGRRDRGTDRSVQ